MGFIIEFAENLILNLMEDPKERDRKFHEHVYATKARCDKTQEMSSHPLRPYGFWTFDRHNAQNFWDPRSAKSQAVAILMMTSFTTPTDFQDSQGMSAKKLFYSTW